MIGAHKTLPDQYNYKPVVVVVVLKIYLMRMSVLGYLYVGVQCPHRQEEGIGAPGTAGRNGCYPPMLPWGVTG